MLLLVSPLYTALQERRILGKCLELLTLACIENHTYQFNEETRQQMKGGAIGLKVTQALARLYMLWWDSQFLKLAGTAGAEIAMYKRYVDDITIIMVPTQPGLEYKNESLIINEENINKEKEIKSDKRTMKIIMDIGNSIHKSIQLTTDYPSEHKDNKIPILDLKVWTERKNSKTMVLHEFYK